MKVVGRGVASLIPAWAPLPSPVAWQAAISRGPATRPGRVAGTLVWVRRPLHISSRRLLLALQQTHIGCGDQPAGTAPGEAGPSELCQARSCLSVAKQAVGGTVRSRSPSPGLWTVTAPLGGLPRSGPGPGPHRALHRTGGVCTRLLPASPGASSRAVTATRFPSPRVNDLPTDALASGCEKPIQWAWSHLSSI